MFVDKQQQKEKKTNKLKFSNNF